MPQIQPYLSQKTLAHVTEEARMMGLSPTKYVVLLIETALADAHRTLSGKAVLEYVKANPGASAAQVGEGVGMAEGVAHVILSALVDTARVERYVHGARSINQGREVGYTIGHRVTALATDPETNF